MNGSTVAMAAVMVLAGIGIPIMAALNSGLGTRLGSPVTAATILFAVALLVGLLVSLGRPLPGSALLTATPAHFFLGGLFVAFYVLAITWIAPRIGVGNAVFFVLLGQLLASALIDHFGWFGAPVSKLSAARTLGIALMAVGVFLARRPPQL